MAFVPLFAFVITVVFALVAGLWSAPVAAALSYVPYLWYAAFQRRPRLRFVRHLGVFALLWFVLTTVLALVLFAGAEGSARGGPIAAYGIEVGRSSLMAVPVLAFVTVVVAGELGLLWMRRQLTAPDGAPTSHVGTSVLAGMAALAVVSVTTCGYCGILGVLAQPRWQGGLIDEWREAHTPIALMLDEMESAPGVQALRAAGCFRVYVVTPAMVERYVERAAAAGETDAVVVPQITTLSCEAYPAVACETLAVTYSRATGSTSEVGVDQPRGSGTSTCSGVYTADGVRLRELRDEERAFSGGSPASH